MNPLDDQSDNRKKRHHDLKNAYAYIVSDDSIVAWVIARAPFVVVIVMIIVQLIRIFRIAYKVYQLLAIL